jgi:hypothetical protein
MGIGGPTSSVQEVAAPLAETGEVHLGAAIVPAGEPLEQGEGNNAGRARDRGLVHGGPPQRRSPSVGGPHENSVKSDRVRVKKSSDTNGGDSRYR